jgi:hypothetical protein
MDPNPGGQLIANLAGTVISYLVIFAAIQKFFWANRYGGKSLKIIKY